MGQLYGRSVRSPSVHARKFHLWRKNMKCYTGNKSNNIILTGMKGGLRSATL